MTQTDLVRFRIKDMISVTLVLLCHENGTQKMSFFLFHILNDDQKNACFKLTAIRKFLTLNYKVY